MGGCQSLEAAAERAPASRGSRVEERGISLAFLRGFIARALEVHSSAITVGELVSKTVRPQCAAQHCCLFELLPERDRGKPAFFISHTWSRPLTSLLSALESFFPDPIAAEGVFLWLDVVAINQVPYALEKGLLEDDVSNLAHVIGCVDSTLFLLDSKGTALTRIWCLFEVWQTIVRKSASALIILDVESDLAQLGEVYNTMSVSSAQATLEEDRVRILSEIERSIGQSALDLQIRQALVEGTKLGLERAELQEQQHQEESDQNQVHGKPQMSTQRIQDALADSLLKHGGMLSVSGQPRKAEPLLRKCWELRRDIHGPESETSLNALHTHAQCLTTLAEYGEALECAKAVFSGRLRLLGSNHKAVSAVTTSLANCHQGLGQFEAAEELLRTVLVMEEERHPPDWPAQVAALSNLAGCLIQRAKYSDARALLSQGHALAMEHLGEDNYSTLKTASNLAGCLVTEGQYQVGREMHTKILKTYEKMFGRCHPTSATSMVNLAGCLRALGDLEAALQLYQEAYSVRSQLFGHDNPGVLTVLNYRAVCLDTMGCPEAEALYLEVLKGRESILGPLHPDTLQTVNDLALFYLFVLDKPQESELLFQRSAQGRREALGGDHPDTLVSINNLAVCFRKLNRVRDAVPLLQTVLAAYQRQLPVPPHSPDPESVNPNVLNCMRTLKSLVECSWSLGQQDDAVAAAQQLAEMHTSWHGKGHERTVAAFHMLGDAFQEAGNNEKAEEVLRPVLQDRLRIFGEEHEDTQETIAVLATAMDARGVSPVTRGLLGLPPRRQPEAAAQ